MKGEIWPFFLTPGDQSIYINSIENKFPDREWDKWRVDISWFNQYYANSGSEHPWHHHSSKARESGQKDIDLNFTNIYYVELDDKSLTTIFKRS